MGTAAIVSFFLIFAAANNIVECQQKKPPLPAFCNGIECPRYESVRDHKVEDRTIEERKYAATSWVSTTMEGLSDLKPAKRAMFWKLFNYIKGNNAKTSEVWAIQDPLITEINDRAVDYDTSISMTVPVKTRITPGQGMTSFTMSFFVSPNQEPAPEPTDNAVRIEKEDSLTFYVTHFGGFANMTSWTDHANQLQEDLKTLKLSFEEGYYYVCGYDAPFKLFNRHNEVWFLKK